MSPTNTQSPQGQDPSSDHDSEESPTKKRRQIANNPYKSVGKSIGLQVDMFRDFQFTFLAGMERDQTVDACMYSDNDNFQWDLFNDMVCIMPTLPDELRTRGKKGAQELALDAGRVADRGQQVKKVKDNINLLYDFSQSFDMKHKQNRGFRHPESRYLLTPISYDVSDPIVQNGLISGDPDYEVGPNDFSPLLWQGHKAPDLAKPELFHPGFLKVMLLVKVLRMILQGTKKASGTAGSHGGRMSRMKTHDITRISVPMIAWAATLTRHALDSEKSFASENFSYVEYYQGIINYVKTQFSAAEKQSLLSWWQEEVFPNGSVNTEASATGNKRLTVSAMMQKARADARAAAEAAAASTAVAAQGSGGSADDGGGSGSGDVGGGGSGDGSGSGGGDTGGGSGDGGGGGGGGGGTS